MSDVGAVYLEEARRSFRGHKRLAEGAFAQLRDDEFFHLLDAEANSVAIIVKHMAGNMRSRFTEFLTTDGEKPNRHRDQEFEIAASAGQTEVRAELMHRWEAGWNTVFDTLASLTPEDLLRKVTIRGEEMTALQAIHRQVAHYAYHVGQIVFIAKHLRGADWKTLSIPKKKSAANP